MNGKLFANLCSLAAGSCALVMLVSGCASSGGKSAGNGVAPGGGAVAGSSKFKATDGRDIEIGRAVAADGGRRYKNPHLEQCWLGDGFDFKGYETLYIAPTLSTAKFNDDAQRTHELAKENLVKELASSLAAKGIFGRVITDGSQVTPGSRTLKLENTIVEFKKGGGAARYWVGLYGGGQPVLRVQGTMTDGDKKVFTYEARRSGASASARMVGAFKSDEDIQLRDIQSLTLDLSDFIAAVAGKYQPRD